MFTVRRLWLCVFAMIAFTPSHASAQPVKKTDINDLSLLRFSIHVEPEDPIDPRMEIKYKGEWKARRGEVVRVVFNGKLKEGYNTYPITQRTEKQSETQLTKWNVEKVAGITPLWPLHETSPKIGYLTSDPYFKFIDQFTWSQDVLIGEDAPMGTLTLPIKLTIQICSTTCEWFETVVRANIEVSDEAPMPLPLEINERLKSRQPAVSVVNVPSKGGDVAPAAKGGGIIPEGLIKTTHAEYKASLEAIAKQIGGEVAKGQNNPDLLGFVLAGIFWGAISLITPCVFPMIPITVSFFLKQSEKEHHRPIVMASVYSLTIVIVLTLAAAFLLLAFQKLSVNPWMNYFIGGLFIFFALSLFGMYEIELPQSLAQFTSPREGRGGMVGTSSWRSPSRSSALRVWRRSSADLAARRQRSDRCGIIFWAVSPSQALSPRRSSSWLCSLRSCERCPRAAAG